MSLERYVSSEFLKFMTPFYLGNKGFVIFLIFSVTIDFDRTVA